MFRKLKFKKDEPSYDLLDDLCEVYQDDNEEKYTNIVVVPKNNPILPTKKEFEDRDLAIAHSLYDLEVAAMNADLKNEKESLDFICVNYNKEAQIEALKKFEMERENLKKTKKWIRENVTTDVINENVEILDTIELNQLLAFEEEEEEDEEVLFMQPPPMIKQKACFSNE
jgi:hypothetical protein